MKKLFPFLFMALLVVNVAFGYASTIVELNSTETDDRYLITTLPKCYGDVLAKVRGEQGVDNIILEHFTFNEKGLYEASCRDLDKNQVVLKVEGKVTNVYDIVIEHHITSAIDNNSKRTLNFNNVEINPQEIKREKGVFVIDWAQTIIFTLVCIGVLVLIIFGIYKLFNHTSKEEQEEAEFLAKKDKIEEENIDNEFENMMEDLEDEL